MLNQISKPFINRTDLVLGWSEFETPLYFNYSGSLMDEMDH